MDILITNDDGIHAIGLRYLYQAALKAGHNVQVVAPLTEQSAVGHAITLADPLRMREIVESDFTGIAVNSTPADCVKFALTVIYETPPDLVLSGINCGPNVGPDVKYSGTVAAATEAASNNCPAMALSFNSRTPFDLDKYADYAMALIKKIDWANLPLPRLLNLNFPKIELKECKGLRVCPQTSAAWQDHYEKRFDPEGRPYWWISGEIPKEQVAPNSDYALLCDGYITLTPLQFDFNHEKAMPFLANLEQSFF